MSEAKKVYAAIAAVSGEMAKTGISKENKNQQQGYLFRGIDDVYNALAPLLSKHHLVILPRILSRTLTERTSKAGSSLFNVVVEAEFDFVSAEDGSVHTARTFGEAMDTVDKATNKAMSAAYKYVAMQAFCIPTAGDNDADAHTHELAPRGNQQQQRPPQQKQHAAHRQPAQQQTRSLDARPQKPADSANPPHLKKLFAVASALAFSDDSVKHLTKKHFPNVTTRRDLTPNQVDHLIAEMEQLKARKVDLPPEPEQFGADTNPPYRH